MIAVGSVGYLNARPLTTHLDPQHFTVVADHPRGIAAALHRREVALALAPVAAVLSDPGLRIVGGVCIGADGPVQSVLFVAETPPEQWTEVRLDGSSRTSVTLARLLLRRGPLATRVRPDLKLTDVGPNEAVPGAAGTVAAVVIGDPARQVPARFTERIDLAEAWKAWTGLPFVFAVWAGLPDVPPAVRAEVVAAGKAGVAAIGETWTGEDLVYLRDHLRYTLDDPALMGLRRFAALAVAEGLLPHGDVSLFAPAPVVERPANAAARLDAAIDGPGLDAADALGLLRAADPADLLLAGHLRRVAAFGEDGATYLVADLLPVDTALDATRGAAVEASDLATADTEAAVAWVRAAVAAGLPPVGLHVPADDDGPPPPDLAALADAGLAGVRWSVHPGPLPAAVRDAAAMGLLIEADLTLRGDETDAEVVQRLAQVADAATTLGTALGSLNLRLTLPTGSLVEPGRATPFALLRLVALARLMLPTSVHLACPVDRHGDEIAQAALSAGADDLGAVGRGRTLEVEAAERLLRVGGHQATRRDAAFRLLGGPLTALRTIRRVEERARP